MSGRGIEGGRGVLCGVSRLEVRSLRRLGGLLLHAAIMSEC